MTRVERRNAIRALAVEVDAATGAAWGTALGRAQTVIGTWLHEATDAELELMRDLLASKRRQEPNL
jgi:hypothetical protein